MCSTGRFLQFAKQAWPRLDCVGIDLSAAYVAEAERHLEGFSRVRFAEGNAEELPLDDASLDLATSIYLFHEVPGDPSQRDADRARTFLDRLELALGGTPRGPPAPAAQSPCSRPS